MKWNRVYIIFLISLMVLSTSLMIFSQAERSEEKLDKELLVFVNPSYQAYLEHDESNVELKYKKILLNNVDEWDKSAIINAGSVIEETHQFKIVLPVFNDYSLESFVVFEIPKTMISRDVYYLFMAALVIQMLVIFMLVLKVLKWGHPYQKLIEGLDDIARGKFEEIHLSDKLYLTYNKAVYELNLVQEKLLKKNVENSLFLSAISHELKTPLATITAHLEALEKGLATNEEKKEEYIEIIRNKFHQLSLQIEDFFKYAQDHSGHLKYNFQEVYFDEYMDQWLSGHSDQVKINNMLPKCLVNLDITRIEQVLDNLFNNALKHTNTAIEIITYREDNYVVVEVKDDGDGIKPKDLLHIFEFYYQGEKSKEIDYEGIGMGLALCKQMLDVHQGKIIVRSSTIKGTTFLVKLPIS